MAKNAKKSAATKAEKNGSIVTAKIGDVTTAKIEDVVLEKSTDVALEDSALEDVDLKAINAQLQNLRLQKKRVKEGLKLQKQRQIESLPPLERATKKAQNLSTRIYRALKKSLYHDAAKLEQQLHTEVSKLIELAADATKEVPVPTK